jgi:hypothetical protein
MPTPAPPTEPLASPPRPPEQALLAEIAAATEAGFGARAVTSEDADATAIQQVRGLAQAIRRDGSEDLFEHLIRNYLALREQVEPFPGQPELRPSPICLGLAAPHETAPHQAVDRLAGRSRADPQKGGDLADAADVGPSYESEESQLRGGELLFRYGLQPLFDEPVHGGSQDVRAPQHVVRQLTAADLAHESLPRQSLERWPRRATTGAFNQVNRRPG